MMPSPDRAEVLMRVRDAFHQLGRGTIVVIDERAEEIFVVIVGTVETRVIGEFRRLKPT